MSPFRLGRRQFTLAAAASAAALATPASARVSRGGLDAFRRRARELGARAIIAMRGNETLVSEGPVGEVQRIASCRKSIINALYGMAVGANKIDISTKLADIGIDDYSPLSDAEKQATIRDLLQARSGVYIPASAETAHMAALRPARGSHPHGTFWYYNNWDFNVLGEIYQRYTGEGLFAAVEHRLAIPLGWRDFRVLEHTQWGYDPASPRFGAYGIWMSTRDMARFGQLFLNRGRWNGQQLIPESWIAESTRAYSTTTYDGILGGYGYLWWLATDQNGKNTFGLPVGSYTAAGNGGRYISIFPEQNILVAVQPEEHEGQPPAQIFTDPNAYAQLLRQLLDAVG